MHVVAAENCFFLISSHITTKLTQLCIQLINLSMAEDNSNYLIFGAFFLALIFSIISHSQWERFEAE
jgi:hypothetical protein